MQSTASFKDVSLEETFRLLEASQNGLTAAQVQERLKTAGYNEVVEKKQSQVLDFALRYWGPMPWLLELAMVLSLLLRHYLEGFIIFALLTVNAIIGHIHARGSQKAVELLKQKLAIRARVLLDGSWVTKKFRELVTGDIISIRLGDIVPADVKVVSGEISVDAAALTGESLPVSAAQSDIVYSGSVVRQGEARCVVVNIGSSTYFGRTAELVKIAKPKSHQEEVMLAIVRYMMYLGIAASAVVALYAVNLHISLIVTAKFAVIFLMGAVPVALPAVLTIVQSVGAMELSRKGVLVTRLDSIEDAASIDVLCLDKTGTITQNKLAVAEAKPVSPWSPEDVVTTAVLTSREEGMDAIDLAIIDYAQTAGMDVKKYRQLSYVPFTPGSRRTESLIETEGKRFKALKGAASVIVPLCQGIDTARGAAINALIEDFSRNGYRTIAVARSNTSDPDRLQLVGFLSLSDPARPDSKSMIRETRKLGIKPMMLSGDSVAIAREIAQQVGIGDRIIAAKNFSEAGQSEQIKEVESSEGLAEIYPEDKYRIVTILQASSHMVGMTGDGVNDAPALKQAEMGIAVSSATDVAKASASVVLTEPGLAVIVDAIKVSRQTYQRMLTWVINKVTKVIEFVVLLSVCFFWLHEIVLSLLGTSLLVFANDFVTMSLATDRAAYTSNPNTWNVKNITLASLVPGMLFVTEGLLVVFIALHYFHLDTHQLRTLVMLNLIFNSQFRVLIVRERQHFWSSRPSRSVMLLMAVTISGFILLGVAGIIVTPLAVSQIFIVLLFSALCTFAIDFPKYYIFKKFQL